MSIAGANLVSRPSSAIWRSRLLRFWVLQFDANTLSRGLKKFLMAKRPLFLMRDKCHPIEPISNGYHALFASIDLPWPLGLIDLTLEIQNLKNLPACRE
jgi:hypothetical protein